LNAGYGHSSPITRVAISPDSQILVSTSADGAIMVWRINGVRTNSEENVQLVSPPLASKREEQKEDLQPLPKARIVSKKPGNKLPPKMNPTIQTINRNGTVRK
jgi:WD40 repeat protein